MRNHADSGDVHQQGTTYHSHHRTWTCHLTLSQNETLRRRIFHRSPPSPVCCQLRGTTNAHRNRGERTGGAFRKRHLSSAPCCSRSTESGTRRGASAGVGAESFSVLSRPPVSPVPRATDEDLRREFDSAAVF